MRYILSMFCAIFCLSSFALAAEVGFTQKDRELLIRLDERLNHVEIRLSELREDMNKRFEQVDKRFEQVDKRFEQVDKRFEQINKQFEFMLQIVMAIVGAFAAIVAVTIGFAIWDRRSMIRPFETKVKEIEKDILEDKKHLKKLIEALRQLAREDHKLASVLRNFALL